ncbi:hypothetical protein [Novosphingopyxis sp.]|uniref:hypothetical protein n=1 Tax=Novosphingopyxis sp. TaxID=2709690 RepID=UPI003B5BDC5B
MTKSAAILLATAALLSACGKLGPLEPAPGARLPVQSYGQTGKVDPQALLEPSTQARPSRSDELLERSEVRSADPFDLPPAGRQADSDDDEVAPPPEN